MELLADSTVKKLHAIDKYKTKRTIALFPKVNHVVYKDPLTIINWEDGVKTIVKCKEGEVFDEYTGFLACVAKRVFGGHGYYRRHIENAHRIDITKEGVK